MPGKKHCATVGGVKEIIFPCEARNFRAEKDLQIQSVSFYELGNLGF